ncbi:MAG: MATE family efflux transporter [Desulfomonile sp.]|nr:MATE family efflux transporter [Desulfomonile sp.]
MNVPPPKHSDDDRLSKETSRGHRTESDDKIADPGGYREVLTVAVPLILSTGALTVNLFVDRMFLAWYSPTAVAAAIPGGITYFTICSLFVGIAQYVNTIVAQYHGAGDRAACARAVWQGVFFSACALPVILAMIPVGLAILAWSGHEPAVATLERDYFVILMLGGGMLPLNAALSSFFSGRGRTSVVMWGNMAGNAINMALAYGLIFGKFGFPVMGIRGAGLATAVAGIVPAAIWAALFLSRRNREEYRTLHAFGWDRKLFVMLLRYGVPAGIQFCLDVAAFTVFVLLIGRLGETNLAVSNIVLSIEMLSFLPMVGMSIATATLVGKYIGRGRPSFAERSVYSALRLALAYMAMTAVLFVTVPEFFLEFFRGDGQTAAQFDLIVEKGTVILRLVAAYTIFDTLFIVFSGALRGAGDTRFAMWMQIVCAWVLFVPPVYIIIERLGLGLVAAWCWGLVYVIILGVVFWLRFRSGAWRRIDMLREHRFKRADLC